MNKKNLIYSILKEITQGNQNQTPKPIIRVEDSKITKFIISFFEKRKDADLIVLNSNGDIWTIDVRATVVSEDDKQTIRERAKALTYQIKRELEETLMKEFAIPNMSIQGIKPVQNNTCDFVISFIYSNKNVDRTNFYEGKNSKVAKILKEILNEDVYYPSQEKERDFEQELQELVDIWVEENIGSESAQGFVSKNPNEIAIKVWALPDNKNIPEAGKSEWRYTAEELCKFLNSQDRQFPFEFHIGSASMTSCWIFTKLN